jgi:hypothetical protein
MGNIKVKTSGVALALLILGGPVSAWSDADRRKVAMELGSLLSSQGACSLSFNKNAVTKYIEDRVPASDMGFGASLMLHTNESQVQYQYDRMSTPSRSTHCNAIVRTARHYGFIN